MTNVRKRLRDEDIIHNIGYMRVFDARIMGVLMNISNNTAYKWMRRNESRHLSNGTKLVTWLYDNRLHGMLIPQGTVIDLSGGNENEM